MKTVIDASFNYSDISTVPLTGNLTKQISSLWAADLLKTNKTPGYAVTKAQYGRSDASNYNNQETAKGPEFSTYNII